MTDLLSDLRWRAAVKKFDPHKRVSEADLAELLEALRLSPSSFGIQPWKFVVVTDPALRTKLRAVSWDQAQVTDASHLLVLCARTDVDEHLITSYADDIARTRGVPREAVDGYADMMKGFRKGLSAEQTLEWSKKQVYLALGTLLAAAARKRIDACPMEGFDHAQYDAILGLKEHNLAATVIVAIGHRAADDDYSKMAKVRFPLEDLVIRK